MERPYITIKFAQTLDGKIAAADGTSRWISGKLSRRRVHALRAKYDAVLIGVGTVLSDNPRLTTRLIKGKNPARVVIDGKLRIPVRSWLARHSKATRTIVFTTSKAPRRKRMRLTAQGVECITVPSHGAGSVDLNEVVRTLHRMKIRKVLVEGGAKITTSLLKAGLADRIVTFICPRILGSGLGSIGDLGIGTLKRALRLDCRKIVRLGNDIVYEALVVKR